MKFSHDIQKLKLFRSALDIIGDVLADLLQQKSLSTSLPQHIRQKNDILFLELEKNKRFAVPRRKGRQAAVD